jgi:hypothetical protein
VSKKRGNGEGSITKRRDGRWMARYTVHTAKGPKRKHIYGKNTPGSGGEALQGRLGSGRRTAL